MRGGGGVYSFVACLSHLTVDHSTLSRRSTVPRGLSIGLSFLQFFPESVGEQVIALQNTKCLINMMYRPTVGRCGSETMASRAASSAGKRGSARIGGEPLFPALDLSLIHI